VAKVRAAIERLRRAGLVAKGASSGTVIDDPLFAEYLRDLSIDTLT
jgi:DNA-binding GntR family transcriptional regulator